MGKVVRPKIQEMGSEERKMYGDMQTDCRRRENFTESMLTFPGG
jgi:hypothetical protein